MSSRMSCFYIALHILDICKMRKNVRIGVII